MYIVGETRCGTTSVSAMIEKHLDVKGPFTPFVHPLAGKESFYFVGHYWGMIHPYFYRMCFPTYFEKWCYETYYQRRMLVYDGCAQYLNSPCFPPHASSFLAGWGDSLGMPSRSASFRVRYPPKDIGAAIELSESKEMQELFKRAENLGEGCRGDKVSSSSSYFLPSWAIPTPNGQLSGLTHMTNYGKNIQRYIDRLGPERIIISPVSMLNQNPKGLIARIKAKLTLAAAAAAMAGGGRAEDNAASSSSGNHLTTKFYDGGGRDVEAERLNASPSSSASSPVQRPLAHKPTAHFLFLKYHIKGTADEKKGKDAQKRPSSSLRKQPKEADRMAATTVFSKVVSSKLRGKGIERSLTISLGCRSSKECWSVLVIPLMRHQHG
eukprot:jgi/Bigna1/83939/fgenesh1_pg.119_\